MSRPYHRLIGILWCGDPSLLIAAAHVLIATGIARRYPEILLIKIELKPCLSIGHHLVRRYPPEALM
ncbi:hypothetical protein EPA93_42055 [Ktedonosporobacter rubrisoli]|uniref:Uncharacterized protein n=1 Tax=Ktedonosporobacter rubrisoli TaxID=2509675 RepID=A0A4P6K3Y2_KTERU|nr:hypothetical protein [Ktedonosporobacter rubrisoli]QBD82216.1 hypothetical protein EPA93_42055 [Ktedonosporobacter rubrisoli]